VSDIASLCSLVVGADQREHETPQVRGRKSLVRASSGVGNVGARDKKRPLRSPSEAQMDQGMGANPLARRGMSH
jgi:hypothetical protein